MQGAPSRVVVTGAGGFLGTVFVRHLLRSWPDAGRRFVLADRAFTARPADARITWIEDDLGHSGEFDQALFEADVVFHLAAIPGGAAERDYVASKQVNLDLSLRMIDALCQRPSPARFVYASSIAVFGAPLPSSIDDDSCPRPGLTYGAHKLMVETALSNLTRLGRIDGISLRLPGLLCRPPGDTGLRSAFMSDVFHAAVSRQRLVIPTGPAATVWLMSASAASECLRHGAELPRAKLGTNHALTMPALRVTMSQLVDEVGVQTGADAGSFSYVPDPALEMQFGRLPPLATPLAERLGFSHDGTLRVCVARALADAGYGTP